MVQRTVTLPQRVFLTCGGEITRSSVSILACPELRDVRVARAVRDIGVITLLRSKVVLLCKCMIRVIWVLAIILE